MHLPRRLLSIVVVACLVLPAGVASAQPARPTLVQAEARVRQVAEAAKLAGEIVITDASGAARDWVLGAADREQERPHRVGQRWLWASVTKQVVAVLVMQEVERGTLALEAPLERYLPRFAGEGSITVRQLLQHRSGLPDPGDTPSGDDTLPSFYRETGPGIGDRERAAGYCAGPEREPPGGAFHYNNCDYLVLGAILEAVTGKDFGTLVRERIARPLGLSTPRLAPDGAVGGGAAATGYEGARRYPAVNVLTYGASAALTGSARDLAAFDRALMKGRLLSPASLATAWEGDPKLGYQALGVWSFPAPLRGCTGAVRLVERRGDVGGTQVRNVIAPELGRALVLFTNDAALEFGEVWQGQGLTHDLLAAAFCPP